MATPRRRGFTLVELLVVVGIISILVALLFPAFSRARAHANRIKCAGNLRSVGHALVMYTQRYGCYPSGLLATDTGLDLYGLWPVRLREFTGDDLRVFYCPSQDERCEWGKEFGGAGRVALPIHVQYGYEPDENLLLERGTSWSLRETTWFSYGYNVWGTNAKAADPGRERGLGWTILAYSESSLRASREVRAARVKVPSEMVAITDSHANGAWDFSVSPNYQPIWPGKVHSGGANVLFCDGHVQWYAQEDLTFPYNPRGTPTESIQQMWNNDHEPY
jgi:prepilin-type processing-associated H-X9-DG protein/prepilin-type N-terminal cleavage/methylation domain-containing protein